MNLRSDLDLDHVDRQHMSNLIAFANIDETRAVLRDDDRGHITSRKQSITA
jgi:hypothetical protein